MKTIDLHDLFTNEELESVTSILLEAFSRQYGYVPEIFEIETNILFEGGSNEIITNI